MDVTLITGTFGELKWGRLANERPGPAARREGVDWIHAHAGTLAQARNLALADVETEFVACVDADDDIEPGFVEAMSAGTADIRAPRVRLIRGKWGHGGSIIMTRVYGHRHECVGDCLRFGNWIVVGAVARTELLRKLGGWREYAAYEDFDLWQRAWLRGASFETIPGAVYRQHLRDGSRNHSLPPVVMNQIHESIDKANGVTR